MKASFFPDINLGVQVAEDLIDRGCLDDPAWRELAYTVLAALHVRNPRVLRQVLERHGVGEVVLAEIRRHIAPYITDARDEAMYQSGWNQFIAVGLRSDVRLRYFLVKILVGGLVQSNSVEEYAREFRRFVVETTRSYLMEPVVPASYSHLTEMEAFAETESKRRPGDGLKWRGSSEKNRGAHNGPK